MNYDLYLSSKMRDNEIESLYQQLLYITRLDVPCDIKSHMRHVIKMDCKERSAKRNMDKVIKEIKLYQYYSWRLFIYSDNFTIYQEQGQVSLKSVG